MMDKEQIETEKLYDNCSAVLKEFDRDNYEFSKDVDDLLNTYADAVRNVILSNISNNSSSIFI